MPCLWLHYAVRLNSGVRVHMNLSGRANLTFSVKATGNSRTNLGVHQLFAACKAVARIESVEKANEGRAFSGFWEDILHDSLVVATTTVASLESYANELYFEGTFIGPALKANASQELAEIIDKEPVLRKFSTALAFRANKQLDYGIAAVQNVAALIKLRNFVVHYRSEWSRDQTTHDRVSSTLKGKFQPSPFLPREEPLLPKAWASYSFGCWAIRSVYTFMDHFYAEAETDSPLKPFKSRLEQLSGCAL